MKRFNLKLLASSSWVVPFTAVGITTITLGVTTTFLSPLRAVANPLGGASFPYTLAQTPDPGSSDIDSSSTPSSSSVTTSRFNCQFQDGEYTVMYNPESQPDESYAWASPGDMGGGWSADRRCTEISRRLEEYRPDGLLELRTAVENGYNTVCATTEQDPTCRIVFTVPQGQDPIVTRDRVFENLAVANSGQDTEAVSTFTGNGEYQIFQTLGRDLGINLPPLSRRSPSSPERASGIDLRPFLDPADGGTGTQLRANSSSLLNPNDFR